MKKILLGALTAVALSLSAYSNAIVMENFVGQDGFYYVPTENPQHDSAAAQGLETTSAQGDGLSSMAGRRDETFDRENRFASFKQWIPVADPLFSNTVVVDGVEYVEFFLDLELGGRSRYMELITLKLFSADADPSSADPLWDMNSVGDFQIVMNNGRFAARGNPDLAVLLPKLLLPEVDQLMIYSEVSFYNGSYPNAVLAAPDPALRGTCTGSGRGQSCGPIALAATANLELEQVPVPATLVLMALGLGILCLRRRSLQ